MKYISFTHAGKAGYGVLYGNTIHVLSELDNLSDNLLSFIQDENRGSLDAMLAVAPTIPLADVHVEAPFPYALRNVICLGKNYVEHVNEVKNLANDTFKIPEVPIYFSKLVDRFTGPEDDLIISDGPSDQVDYEVELAVIIGKTGKNIAPEEAYDYIFGYAIGNDFSARDLQSAHNQWFRGKSIDGYCGFGPVIVSRDEIPEPPALRITSHVNGELRQNGNTDLFIFDIPYILSDFSRNTTLRAGDIILTGTPAGVGAGFEPPRFLNPGDVVRCEIEKIGVLETTLR